VIACDAASDDPSARHGVSEALARGITLESPAEALAFDNQRLASELQLPIADIDRAMSFQSSFAEYQDEILERFPNRVAGTWVEPVPAVGGHIRFVGDVPASVAAQVKTRADLRGRVTLHGGGATSLEEQAARVGLITDVVAREKYTNFAIGFDPIEDAIRIRLGISNSVFNPTHARDALAASARTLAAASDPVTAARVRAIDWNAVKVVVTGDTSPLLVPEHSRGGAWLGDDGVRECTSGWTVDGPDGDGILTAGHCRGLNEYYENGVLGPYSMTWRAQILGAAGDAEYHTTSHVEEARFYSNSATLRNTLSLRSTNTMVGRTVCFYGRSSNLRTCNHVVQLVGETVGVAQPGGGFLITGNLAEATNVTSQSGDSGGGWSYASEAFGLHVGAGGGFSYFLPGQVAEDQLDVTILLQ